MRQECKDICSQVAYIVYNAENKTEQNLRKNTKAERKD